MDGSVTQGTWWLPGQRQHHKAAGALVADSGSFRLVLQESLRHFEPPDPVDGVITHAYGGPQWVTVPVIHGYTNDRIAVTVFGACGTDMAGPFETVEESYNIDLALTGGHIDEDLFSGIQVEFDWLDAWLDPPSITGDTAGILDLSIVQSMPIEIAAASVGADRIAFMTGVTGEDGGSAVHLDRTSYAVVTLHSPVSWRDALDEWVRPIQDFLSVAVGQTVQMNWVYLAPTDPDPWGRGTLQARFRATQAAPMHTSETRSAQLSSGLHSFSSPTILTARDVRSDLGAIIENWLSMWQENSAAISLLLAHMYAPFMYTTQRYASIFQAIEGLHSQLFPGAEKAEDEHRERVRKIIDAARAAEVDDATILWAGTILMTRNDKSLAQRVEEVVRHTGAAGVRVMTDVPQFGKLSAKARGTVAHPRSKRDKISSATQYWLGETMAWIARAILLDLAGVANVGETVAGKSAFHQTLELLQVEIGKLSTD